MNEKDKNELVGILYAMDIGSQMYKDHLQIKPFKIDPKGYFVKGRWFKGLHPKMIGKKIIRTQQCVFEKYVDYSYSYISEKPRTHPSNGYVILHEIKEDRSLVVEWNPYLFPGVLKELSSDWNDGNWIEYFGINERPAEYSIDD